MIISHKYKFIFIKTSKTAGTSTEIALSRYCGDDDVITKNSPEDEIIRNHQGGRNPQNHYLSFSEYSGVDWARLIFKRKRLQLRSHFSASFIRNFTGDAVWNNYFKFCFERNPWDRTVSLYYHHLQDRKYKKIIGPNISEYISAGYPEQLRVRGFYNYTIDGKIAVNRVCLYENLEAELEYVCNHILGLPEPLILPRAKGQHRKDKRHYREILGNEDRDRIAELFTEEIRRFGYSF